MTRFHNHFLFSALYCCIVSGVYCITVDQFYKFGESAGDSQLSRVDDGSSPPITLRTRTEFPFFDENRKSVYVNTNGVISFSRRVSTFTPEPFPIPTGSESSLELIAPFWADVDVQPSQAGTVFYRETSDPELLSRARSDIMRDPRLFPEVDFSTFLPTSIFVATWDHVGYYLGQFDKTNTFQCVLVTDGRLSFLIFLYAEGLIQWTTGSASGGINGFGGTPAQVGFNAGDGIQYASVEGSQTPDIVNIDERRGNTGLKGVWIFRVDGKNIHVTNCTSIDDTTDLVILPNRGHILGGTSVIVSGPCFDESQVYTCLFQVRRLRREVRGVYLDEKRLLCVSPLLYLTGDVGFMLRVQESGGTVTEIPQQPVPFYSLSFFTAYQVNLVGEDLLFTGEESVSLTWLPDAVFPLEDPGNYMVDVWLYTLSVNTWAKTACLASAYPNSGRATVTIPHMEHPASGRFSAIAIQIALNTNQTEPELFQNLTTTAGLWTVVAYATDTAPTRKECNDWAENSDRRMTEQNTINSRSPPCPCMLQQARAPNSGFNEQTLGDAVQNFFNPGAATCFYQSSLNRALDPGRQCCYDECGSLILGPGAGGHSDFSSPYSQSLPPSFSLLLHLQRDITPFLHCCKSNETSCTTFYTFRPSAISECQYSLPPPALSLGTPIPEAVPPCKVTAVTPTDGTCTNTDLAIIPNRGHILGGTSVIVSGPCFDESQEYTCLFQVRRARREVRGVYLDERRLLCVSPLLYLTGDVGFMLRVQKSGGTATEIPQQPVPFYSLSFLTAYQVNLVREDLLFTGEESISLTWLPDAVFPMEDPGNYTVDVWLYTLSRNTWLRTACLASAYPNSGRATVTIPRMERSATGRFSAIAMQVVMNTSQADLFQMLTTVTAPGLWTVVVYAADTAPSREECSVWAKNTVRRLEERNTIDSRSPPCPCMLQAPNNGFTEQNVGDAFHNYFNPGAATCLYQSTLNPTLGPGRQCCYDERGRLIMGPAAGGHSDFSSPYSQSLPPSFALLRHLQRDITPFLHCCKSNETSCTTFYTFRPSAVSECQYSPPPPGNGTSLCTVRLINESGLVYQYGHDISIQFLGSSSVHFYLCRIDGSSWFTCRSPITLYGLATGPHHFQVLPQGCGSNRRRASMKFNVE